MCKPGCESFIHSLHRNSIFTPYIAEFDWIEKFNGIRINERSLPWHCVSLAINPRMFDTEFPHAETRFTRSVATHLCRHFLQISSILRNRRHLSQTEFHAVQFTLLPEINLRGFYSESAANDPRRSSSISRFLARD